MSNFHQWNIEFFPQEFIVLSQECLQHPDLQAKLAAHPSSEFEVLLAEIASHCDVCLDGIYDREQQIELARILANRLYSMRAAMAQSIEVIRDPSVVPFMKQEASPPPKGELN